MTHELRTVPVGRVLELAEFFAGLSWPIAADDLPDVIAPLGIDPNTVHAGNLDDEVADIVVPLTEKVSGETPEGEEQVSIAAGDYILALVGVYGEAQTPSSAGQRAEAHWELESGARLRLKSTSTLVTLHIESPSR